MAELSLQEKIYSNDYFDIILPYLSNNTLLDEEAALGQQAIGKLYRILHIRQDSAILPRNVTYSLVPKLFALQDTASLEASGILRVQNQPSLALQGENVLIGFVDTGIDYTLDAFRSPDGRSRIAGIWDQTRPSETPPFDLGYGTAYTTQDIDTALLLDSPYEAVPQRDENGHGTFMAGVACGSEDISGGFLGAAPKSQIAMVKLKPAKQNLRDYFLIQPEAEAYQETDIMLGILYLIQLAQEKELPLVICLGLGSSQGDHNGSLPLERYLSYLMELPGNYCTVASGNETGLAHHYYQNPTQTTNPEDTELLVDEYTDGFMLEIWADSPDLFGISITSPLGENIPWIPPRIGGSTTYNFVAEKTSLDIIFGISEYTSGAQYIILRFQKPTPGIWRLRVSSSRNTLGSFHMWLPVAEFISPGTVFLDPNPFTTLTAPSTAETVITLGGYDAYSNSLFLNSGRGYTRTGIVKPDLAAPAVYVFGPAPGTADGLPPLNKYVRKTGTSGASAITAGAVALLINWNMLRSVPRQLSNRAVKNYLALGAVRSDTSQYPNREWGYGLLNLYRIFESLM